MQPRPEPVSCRSAGGRGCALALLLLATAPAWSAAPPAGGAAPRLVARLDVPPAAVGGPLDPAERERIERMLATNLAELERRELLPRANAGSVLFEAPVRGASAALGARVYVVTLFVDHDLAHPDRLLDFHCGDRTYDLPTYDHGGSDFISWPFAWWRMERDEVLVIAAADGVIVGKDDGHPDRSCDWETATPWNAVYVRHADGTVAWYGHMKNGTPTAKPVGAAVAAGEVLGVVGSSGRSSAPHLHFEVRDAQNLLLDPYAGPCNGLNSRSMWRQQPAYYDSGLNLLSTHSGVPERPPCPQSEVPKLQTTFSPGQTVYLAATYRDQLAGEVTRLRILRPDGSTFHEWTEVATEQFRRGVMWIWEETLPTDAPPGTWRFVATHLGRETVHSFGVAAGSGGGGCTAGDRLCLLGGRFQVEVAWQNPFNGASGSGIARPESDLAGFFAFDDPANVELMVKLLDFGDRVLLFYGQLTTLPFTLRFTDTTSGEVKSYGNGPRDCGAIDSSAFAGSGAASLAGAVTAGPAGPAAVSAAASAACPADGESLCLLGGRFRARLAWSSPYSGAAGRAQARPMSDLAGSFSFDDPRNVEVLVKTLDFGDRVLVLWGSLSDFEYTLEVTELATGRTKTYRNPPGTYCGGLDERF